MSLTNDQIGRHVEILRAELVKDKIVKPDDEPILNAVTALITNLLQNINDIAAKPRGDV